MAQRQRAEREERRPGGEGTTRSQTTHDESPRDISSDEISTRAYELYEQRGAEPGHDWDDWLQAERELQARRRTPGPTPS